MRPLQVLVRSQALEISIESALVTGLAHEHGETLSHLCAAFVGPQVAQALASQLIRLASLLADEAPDTLGAAQRAARNVVASLKSGEVPVNGGSEAVTTWLSRVSGADKEIAKQQSMLEKLTASSAGVVTK